MAIQVTSVLGDTVTDTIQNTSGGSGSAQFPKHALSEAAAAPASNSTLAAGGRRLLSH